MTTDNKQELKIQGWTGGFAAPKMQTRRLIQVQPLNLNTLLPATDNDDPRSQRRLSIDSIPDEQSKTGLLDCFNNCVKKK